MRYALPAFLIALLTVAVPSTYAQQDTLAGVQVNSGLHRVCTAVPLLVSPTVADSVTVSGTGRMLLRSQEGITLRPGFRAGDWQPGGRFLGAINDGCHSFYVWNGSVSTDWGNPSNWTPNGVPDDGDTVKIGTSSKDPVLDRDRTIARIHQTHDTLHLGGHTLTVMGTLDVQGDFVDNGKIVQRAAATDTTRFLTINMACKLDVESGRFLTSTSVFGDSTRFSRIGNLTSVTGGNVYLNHTELASKDSGLFYFGSLVPDSFMTTVDIINMSKWQILMCYRSVGNYFGGDVRLLNCTQSSVGRILFFHNAYPGSSANFHGNVTIGATGGSSIGIMEYGQVTIESGKAIRIDTVVGYAASFLYLRNIVQLGDTDNDLRDISDVTDAYISHGSEIGGRVLTSGAKIFRFDDSEFHGDVIASAGGIRAANSRFNGDVDFTRTGWVGGIGNGGNRFNKDLTFSHEKTVLVSPTYWGYNSADTVIGNLTLVNKSAGVVSFAYSRESLIGGNVTLRVDSTVGVYMGYTTGRMVTLNGSGDQVWTSLSSNKALEYVYDVRVNKPSGEVLIPGELDVRTSLNMLKGNIRTTGTGQVRLRDNAVVTGASDSSYVDGPVLKVGNDAFTYPVGDEGVYRPLAMTAPNTTSAQYLVNHMRKNPNRKLGMARNDTTIKYITPLNYWEIERLASTSNVKWSVSWHSSDNYIFHDPDSAVVAGWNGTGWKDLGNEAVTGDTANGSVRSSVTINPATYSALALGSESARVLPKSLEGSASLSASQSDTSDVAVTLMPNFGVGEVSVVWNRASFPKESYMDSLWSNSAVLDSFFVALGDTIALPDSIIQSMVGRKHSWVGSGLHEARMVDDSGDTLVFDVPIASPVDFLTLSGVTYSGDSLTKSSVTDGWTTGHASLMGVADSLENGAVQATIADITALSALGLKSVSVSDTGGYEHMAYAAVFDGTDVHVWYKDSLYENVSSAAVDDEFSVSYRRGVFSLSRNGIEIHAADHGPMGKIHPGISLAHAGKTPFTNILLFFPRPRVTMNVVHQSCSVANSGSAQVQLSPSIAVYPHYSCVWYHTGVGALTEFANQLSATGLAPGNYTFTFYPSPSALPVVTYFRIDYWVDWTNLHEVSEHPNDASVAWVNPLSPSTPVAPILNSGADSHNNLSSSGSGYVQFKLGQQGIAGTSDLRIHGMIGLSPTAEAADPGLNVKYAAVPISVASSPSMNYFAIVKDGVFQAWAMAPANNPIGFYRFDAGSSIGFTHGSGIGLTGVPMHVMTGVTGGDWVIDASVIMGSFEDAWTSFPCVEIPFGLSPCAKLLREVDGGYHWVLDGKLTFVYEEEYVDEGDLSYRVLNGQNQVVLGNTGTVPNTVNDDGLKYYGDNRFQLSMGSVIPNGMYILEVTSDKSEKFYLRFKKGI